MARSLRRLGSTGAVLLALSLPASAQTKVPVGEERAYALQSPDELPRGDSTRRAR